MTLHGGTLIGEFYGRPATWGAALRTISASSGGFTCTTTFGHAIAGACDDGTVDIYDSTTGVLRLSLSPANLVQKMRGSPDGSMLFCTHEQPSITLWDIQTGGLMHTFVLEWRVEDIAVSLKGSYVAFALSDGTTKIWEIAEREEGAAIGSGPPATHLCWLEPEEQLAVVKGELVHIWDVVARKVLRRFAMGDLVCDVAYSKKLNRLAIVTASGPGSTITIIHPGTDASFTDRVQRRFSCFAFSQTTRELVCGRETDGVELLDISTGRWREFNHPAKITSVSTLSNGTVVADVVDSGIQLLTMGKRHAPSQQPTIPALAVNAFDEGRIIAILSACRNHIALLELATMLELLTIPTKDAYTIPTDHIPVLFASLQHDKVACCLEKGDKRHLQLWEFRSKLLKWVVEINEMPSIGGISPSGAQFATLHNANNRTHVYLWDAQNGQSQAHLLVDPSYPTPPLDLKFESEDRFYSQHDAHRISYLISSSEPGAPGHSIIRHEQLPSVEQPQRCYDVDDTVEWVVASSERVCWIPPGYIGSGQRSFCWVGQVLVMAGQDGTLRMLTFRERR